MKKKTLALFDLDDTLFNGDTEAEWVSFMYETGLIKDSSFAEKMKRFNQNYREGILNVHEYSEFLLSPIIGVDLKDLEGDIDTFTSDLVDRLTDELTQELLEKHFEDYKILTSGSLSFLVNEIGRKLGIKTCFGTEPEYIDGAFTGKVVGQPNFSDEKVIRVKDWIGNDNFEEVYAYSDSIHDLPLLEFSDKPFVISPDKQLRALSIERNWAIRDR